MSFATAVFTGSLHDLTSIEEPVPDKSATRIKGKTAMAIRKNIISAVALSGIIFAGHAGVSLAGFGHHFRWPRRFRGSENKPQIAQTPTAVDYDDMLSPVERALNSASGSLSRVDVDDGRSGRACS